VRGCPHRGWGGAPEVVRASFRVMIVTVAHSTMSSWCSGRLKSRLRPMRTLTQLRCVRVISAGHAFVQNIRRDHYELGVEEPTTLRMATAVTEPALAI
jgi:hypothetical protein